MPKHIVQDIWDREAFKNSIKAPYESLSLKQIRSAIGMERDCRNGKTFYYIPVTEQSATL